MIPDETLNTLFKREETQNIFNEIYNERELYLEEERVTDNNSIDYITEQVRSAITRPINFSYKKKPTKEGFEKTIGATKILKQRLKSYKTDKPLTDLAGWDFIDSLKHSCAEPILNDANKLIGYKRSNEMISIEKLGNLSEVLDRFINELESDQRNIFKPKKVKEKNREAALLINSLSLTFSVLTVSYKPRLKWCRYFYKELYPENYASQDDDVTKFIKTHMASNH